MRGLPALVTVLALLAPARGGPISSLWDDDGSTCATKCVASQKFQYAQGTTYEFDYTADTSTGMEDASEDTARLSVTATALVHVISDCDMVLQLRDVTVKESDPNSQSMRTAPESARAAALLERQPLRFSFQDGVVEELCPSAEDELWALNVKRGVLSAFQNSMSRLDSDQTVTEVDVAGSCPSKYHVENKGWYSTTVKRSKDLLACTDRHDLHTALIASPYTVKSSVQSLPLMKSTHECEQNVDQNGILSSATCTERHLFRPFSREASGAVTKVSQTLKHKSQSRSPVTVQPVTKRTSLMYDHGDKEETTRRAQQEAEEVLRQLCRDTATDIRPDTPRVFSSLVSAMRRVDVSGLRALYAKLLQNTLCANNIRTKKFFVDALPMAGTEATVTMMTQMLMNDDVTGVEADMWLTSLALIQEPTSGMLQQAASLLTKKTMGEKAMLPVSTMVNNLCQRDAQCSQDSAVQTVMAALEDVIGSSCYVNKKNLDKVLIGLRAIGNAGHVSRVASVLNKCLNRNKNPMEVRVAAAQAFRRMPCDANRDSAMFVLEDKDEDSELRIASYLAVMTCPDDITLQRVQLLLESDLEEQVGSFVWSHLSNLQETSSPHKQAVRELLKRVQLPAKYNLGRLQFSRNYEGSAFLQRLQSGAAAEGNLVWSSSSSLPRSASANLTVDVFGRSLNLLDVGVRLEGLEYLLETLLGPYGYFGQDDKDSKKTNKLDELKGSLYMRMFGNEMTYQRFQGMDSFTSSTSFNMLDFLIKLSKDHDISMTHSMEFLDTEMTVPTSSGLPLSLSVKGTATVDLKASGKVDLRKVSAKPRSLQIDGEIRPSGAVRVSGQMSVDAMVSRAALHVTGTLHSSSAVKGRVDLDRGRVLSVELDVPEEKMEIFDISSEFSIMHNTVEKKQKMITENRRSVKLCTGDMAARVTGLELCGELQYPNASTSVSGPYFPLTGPASLSVTLYKRDTLTSYKLLAKRVENKKKTMAQLSFNTPGSKVDRSMAFDLVLDHEDRQLEVSAASPWTKAEFKGGISATKKLVGVSGSFIIDDVNTYAVTSEVKIDESKNGVTYTPLVEVRRPGSDNMALTGMITMETMKSATADLTLAGVTAQPWTFKSALTNTKKEISLTGSVANGDKNEYSVRVGTQMNIGSSKKAAKIQVNPFLSVKTPRRELVSFSGSAMYNQGKILKADMAFNLLNFKPATAQLTAAVAERKAAVRYTSKLSVKSALVTSKMDTIINVKKGRLINGRCTLSYNVPRVVRDKLVMMAKLSDRSTKAYNKYTVRSSLDSKSFPDYNTAVKLNLDHKKKLSSGELEVKYGSNPKDKNKRVALSATLARKIKDLSNMDLTYKMQAEAPELNITLNAKGKHSHTRTSLDSNVALTYAKGKVVSADLTLRDKSSKLTKMLGGLTLQAPGTGLTLKTDLTQASKKQWEHNVNIKTGGSKHSLSTVYKTPGGRSQEVASTLAVAGMKPITVSGQASLDWDDLQLAASLKHGKAEYGVSGTHKLAKSRSGKWSVEVTVPSRRVVVNAQAGKVKGNYETSLDAAWDADNDKNAKVEIEGMVGSKTSKDGSSSHKARVSVATPIEGYRQMVASAGLDSSSSQHQLSTQLVMGSKKNVISSSLVVATPFTPYNIDLTFKADTPYQGYGSMGMAFTHKLDAALSTKLSVSLQKDKCDITLTAQNRGTDTSRDLQAQLDVKSTMRKTSLRSLSVAAAHKDNGQRLTNNVDVTLNGKVYSYGANMDMGPSSNTGDLTLTWPKQQVKSVWSHRHSTNDLNSTITTTWGSNKRVQLDVTGSHATGSLSGSVALQTPWSKTRDLRAVMNTQYGAGRIMSTSSVKDEGRDAFTHSLSLGADASKADLDFSMTSPWTQLITSKLNVNYASFPMSANTEFSWEPRKKVTAEGSVILNNWDDLDLNMRVTTPVRGMRSVAAEISSKAVGSEVVSKVNVDLGMRKNVVLTSRVQGDFSGAHVKLITPWDELRVMDTGLDVDVQSMAAGKVKADFKAVPLVGSYEAVATWNMEEDEPSARFRLDTPRDDLPYLQIVMSSKEKRHVRQSRVELEYSPSHTYSLDSTYSLDLPLVLDVSVATPLSGYESLSASFRHNMRQSAMDTSAQVTYTNDKVVKATAMLDWSRGLDSSLVVNTPFSGWEQSSATLRHEGEWNDFSSLADVTVGGQSVTGNLKLMHKMKTDAQLSLTTPWAGWEKIEATMSRKGDWNNLRGTASVVYGDQKMEGNVMNKWNSRKARLVASLTTPYTQDLSLNFEQSADMTTDASLSYGSDYSVDSTSKGVFNSRQVSGSTKIKYRLGGPRHVVTASLAKTGSLQDLVLSASSSLDKKEVSVTAELNTLRDIKATLAVRTPFNGYESVGASFQQSGDLSAMTAEANVEYMTDNNVHGKVELGVQGLQQLSFRGTLTSPLTGLERSVVSLSHVMGPKLCSGSFSLDTTVADLGALDASYQKTGKLDNFKGEAHVTFNGESLLDANLAHLLTSTRLQSSVRVLTPALPELNVEVNHRGDSSQFRTKASASAGADKVSSHTQWSMSENKMDLNQNLASTLQGDANRAGLVLSRVGPLTDLTLQLSGNVNARKAKVVGQLATEGDVSASVEVESPFDGYRQLGASVRKTGELSDLSVTAAANLEQEKMEIVGKFNTQSDVRGSLDITTPFPGYSQMGTSFTYGGENAMLSANLLNDRILTTGRFVNNDVMEGSVDITTPFTGYSQMGAAFSYGRNNAMMSANLMNDKIQATGRYVNDDVKEGSVEVQTPFTGYSQMGASFTCDGENAMVSANLMNDKIQANGRFVNDDVTEGSVDITTPFTGYSQMGASFTYGGETAKMSANLMNDKIQATGRFANNDVMEGSVDVQTPFTGYNQMGASFNYGGENAMLSANLMNDKIQATGRFVNTDVMEGSLDVQTPFTGYSQMGASFNYGGENAMLSANLMNDKIQATGRLVNSDVTEGSVELQTPFNGYSQMGASFQYDGTSMTANANLQNDRITASANYDNSGDLSGSVDVSTPFTGYRQMGGLLRVAGDVNDITVTANGQVENSKMEVNAAFSQLQDVSGSLHITTPFPGYTAMGTSFALNPDLRDLTLTADAYLQQDKAEVKAAYSQGQEVTGSVQVITPFNDYRQMGASFQQRGGLDDFSLQLAANLLNDKLEATATLTDRDGLSGAVTIATPFSGFRQLGASFKHSGHLDRFRSEGQLTYMDGKDISGKVSFLNQRLRRIETSAELSTPFPNWEMTKVSYTHSGSAKKFECNAKLECSRGHEHTANLKVDLRRDQDVQVTVKTPYEGFRLTQVTHSLSKSDSSAQWNGAVIYGEGQRASSQLTVSLQDTRFSSHFELQTPFTSDLTVTFDQQGSGFADLTRKMAVQYGDMFQFAQDMQLQFNESPLWLVHDTQTFTLNGATTTRSLYLRREGPWNDVTLVAKAEQNGEEIAMDASFKNEFSRLEGNVKVNTPFEGFNDIGASFQHVGELTSAFNTEAKVEYTDDQEVAGKLDFMRVAWQRLEITTQLTTPFEHWEQTQAEYRHTADAAGFACYAGAEYQGDQRVTGDLRVTSSPNPEVTVTVKTPWTNWEQLSATGAFQDDGWGKKEVSSKLDLGRDYVYTINSGLVNTDDSGLSINTRLTTPHADWRSLEARVSHEGGVADFKSSAYLSTPLLDAVSGSASVRYSSPFDLTAAASLDTPFDSLKDWKFEMTNGERGTQKTTHVILGWSGDQEVVMDGTWRHDNSYYERRMHADISLSSPFEAVRQTSWVLEHHATQSQYEQKMTGSLNGDKLIDLDLTTVNGDLPEVTLTLTEPYNMLYSASRTSEGAELTLDWDRNDPSSNLRVTSRFTDSSDSTTLQHDLDLQVIHPSRTVGTKYSLQSSPLRTSSQGELYWGRGDNRRLNYVLDLSDLSRRSSSSYEGKVKVGMLSRAVQLSGAVSRGPMSRQMDATLSWDADRDQDKQVSVKTAWTPGDKNKVDLTLSVPAIQQELHVQSEVAVNQGKTLLDATTALSYSQDRSKVLTLSSTLQDTTGSWDTGSNYTLRLSLTHPHTDLDLSMTSHLGASDNRYSASVDTWYLTSRRQRKNLALRGEIDQLRRQMTMEMVSPVKKVSMKGEVKSVEPYSLSLTNRYDDDATIQADVTVDTNKRSVVFKTNYDLEHPERSLVMKAFYVNDTAVRAEVYRDHVSDVITDALLALRLNTSTLLHSRLHWRSASLGDLQEYAINKLSRYASHTKQSVNSVNEAVREELTARYARCTAVVAEELRPGLELLQQEMAALGQPLVALQRQLTRLYRRHTALRSVGSAVSQRYITLMRHVATMSSEYQQTVQEMSEQMSSAMQTMTQFPVGQHYQQAVDHLLVAFEGLIDTGLEHLVDTVVSLDNYLLAAREHGIHLSNVVSEVAHNVSTHPRVLYMRNSLDITPYIDAAVNKVSALRMPEEYTAAIYRASGEVNQALSDVMNMAAMKQMKEASSAVYQEGLWAYRYWQAEDNLKKHLHSIATLLKEIVQEELQVYTRHFTFLQKSGVSVWDPEHGEIQAEIHLPVAMETLDSMPDVTPLVEQYNDVMDSMPDKDTVQYFYDNYVPQSAWWSSNKTSEDKEELMEDLKEFTPTKVPRKLYRKKYGGKRQPTVAAI